MPRLGGTRSVRWRCVLRVWEQWAIPRLCVPLDCEPGTHDCALLLGHTSALRRRAPLAAAAAASCRMRQTVSAKLSSAHAALGDLSESSLNRATMLLIQEYGSCSWSSFMISDAVRAGTMLWRKRSFSILVSASTLVSYWMRCAAKGSAPSGATALAVVFDVGLRAGPDGGGAGAEVSGANGWLLPPVV